MSYTFVVPHAPKPKERPRMTRRGRTYTPQATHEAEELVMAAYDGPVFEGPVGVTIGLWPTYQKITVCEMPLASKLRGDIDNYAKLTLDGLVLAGAFANDRAVVRLRADKH